MKLLIILLTLLHINTLCFAQETKRVKTGNDIFLEEFTVLKSDKKIRHGEYKEFQFGKIRQEGLYNHGKKIGIWKFYHNGLLIQSYNYDKNQIENEPINPFYLVYNQVDFIESTIDSPPTYIGGKVGLENSIRKIIRYPVQARNKVLEGEVVFSLVVDENANVSEIEILSGPMEFHEEVKNTLTNMEALWLVGRNNNEKIKCKLLYVIEFKLNICGGMGCSLISIK